MGWTSSGDAYQSEPPLVFENALDAVYFAKKRGWKYIVKEPIRRQVRDDGAQYQDNFFPQAIAARVAKERKQCDQWKRVESGASHYFRPLKYHGKGVVPQYGTNPDQETAPHVEAYYKIR
jgi:ETC complex I subunit conserved region